VEAILFALYGVRGLGSSTFVVSASAGERAKAEVVLEFTVRGEQYEVYRSIKRRASTHEARLLANGKKRAEGVSAVEAEITRILGMGWRDFKNTIYAGQKDLLSLLSDNPRERKDWFMRVLGIDYLRDDTDQELKARIDAVASRCRELEGGLAVIDEPALAEEVKERKRVLSETGKQVEALAAAHAEEKEDLVDLRKKGEEARMIEKHFIQLREQNMMRTAELERLAHEITALEAELRAREVLQADYEALAVTEDQFRTLEETLRIMAPKKARHDAIRAEQQQLDFRIAQYGSLLHRLGQEIASLQTAGQRVKALEKDVARFREIRDELEQLGTREKEFLAIREAIGASRERYRGLEHRIRVVEGEMESLRRRSADLAAVEERLRKYDALAREQDVLSRAKIHATQRESFKKDAEQADALAEQCCEAIRLLDAELSAESQVQTAMRAWEEKKEGAAREQAAQRSRMESLGADLVHIDERLSGILTAGQEGSCPTCHQPLGDHFDALVKEFLDERSRCAEALADSEDRREEAARDYEAAGRELTEAINRRDALQKVREERQSSLSLLATYREQGEKARRGLAGEQQGLRDLGLEEFVPERLQEVMVKREALERVKVQAERLAGECSRLPAVEEQHIVLMREAEDCIHDEELLANQVRALAFSPAVKEEREKEVRALLPLWQEYLRAHEKAGMVGEKQKEMDEITRERDTDKRAREDREGELGALGFDPAHYASLLKEMESGQSTHARFIEVRTRLEEVPALRTQLEGKKGAMDLLRKEIDTLVRRIQKLAYDPEALPLLEGMFENCLERLRGIERAMDAQHLAAQHCREEIGRLDREVLRAQELRADLVSRKKEKEVLELTREAMGAFVTYLLNVVKGQVQGEVGKILSEITDGRYDTVTIDNEFNLLVHDMGEDYPAQRFSGGEQDDIAIALRIALSRYLAALHQVHDSTFLIFDEIFGSQDEARRGNLLQALRTQESHFPQILLISHIAEVQGEFSHTLSVEMHPDQTSVVQELSA
jgi:DNA repair exonuclease SbcCD ATPase subunit